MASNARRLSFCFFFLVVSFSPQTQARESKFFSKFTHHYQHVTRKTLENPESVGLSPAQSPSLAPAPSPEPDAKSTDVVGEVKHVEAHVLGDKTFRDFVMSYPNDNHDGWNGSGNENENQKGTSQSVEEENGYETERQRKGQKMYLVHGKYYYGYVTGENAKENEKQGVDDEHVEDENSLPNSRGNEKQEMGETKYYVNGKYYTGYVTKSENGKEDEKKGMNEYVEDQGKENVNEYEYGYEKQGNKYLVNGKYYNGYITGENEKQGMDEYVGDERSFPESKGHSNEYEIEKQDNMGDGNKYFVNGKYYSGYVTKAENGNQYENENENEKQYMEEESGFPEKEDKGNEYEYETEKQAMGENKYLVNGKYDSGYVTKSENGDEKLGRMDQGKEKYFVNGKYYSGYVTGENRDLNNQDYSRHKYGRQGTGGGNAVLPRQYDSMDEYDNEQEYMP